MAAVAKKFYLSNTSKITLFDFYSRKISLNRGFGSEFQCEAHTFNSIAKDCFDQDCSQTNGNCINSPGNTKKIELFHILQILFLSMIA